MMPGSPEVRKPSTEAVTGEKRSTTVGCARTSVEGPNTRNVAWSTVSWRASSDLDLAEWIEHGRRLGLLGRNSGWWIGDWLRYGNAKYGERYSRAVKVTGYDRQTLMNMVYVASRFESERRRPTLSWSHHAEVAGLSAEEQDRWIERAEAERMSVRDLREQVRTERRAVHAVSVRANATQAVQASTGADEVVPISAAADGRALRQCLAQFATGVAVVSCRAGDEPHGTTVNGFTSVSLDPPLVLVALNRNSKLCARITQQSFAISILGQDWQSHALHFAGHEQPQLAIEWNMDGVAPRLAGAVAYLECSPWRAYDGGDHVLQVGRVEQFGAAPGKPLLFYASAFYALGGAIPKGSS